MLATAPNSRRKRGKVEGSQYPRLAPPVPAADIREFEKLAQLVGTPFWPWQKTAARYLLARTPDGAWLYPEVAVVAARQNGKTTILAMLIVSRLLAGHRIVHAAQNLDLPRETHSYVADIMTAHFGDKLAKRRAIRFGSGQERIHMANGGRYRIAASTRGGARGPANDLVLVDEVLELEDFDFIAAAKPTMLGSPTPQIAYFSNAGSLQSAVLNSLRERGGNDPTLAYLEWSAGPDRKPDELAGWLNANPSIGHNPATLPNLEREYRANLLGGTMDVWEREHLCRWTLIKHHELLVAIEDWRQLPRTDKPEPKRPVLGIKMDISGERASMVLAWQEGERTVVSVQGDVTGAPIASELLGPRLKSLARELRATSVAYDPYTDGDLARYLDRGKALKGPDYALATEKFARLVAGKQLVVHDPDRILEADLASTVRRVTSSGTVVATKASPELTNSAAEAAIRAVWLASAPQPRAMVH